MTTPENIDPRSWLPTPPWRGLLPPLFGLPWERQEEEEPRIPRRVAPVAVAPAPSQSKPMSTSPNYMGGPGCRAADACLLVHGYLVNLAEGKSGFGVLRVAKERLEQGAIGAAQMGQAQLAQEMRAVAQELPQVTTPEAAAALAPKLKNLSDQTWDLGRRCGGHNLNPAALEQARALARDVKEGRLTMDQAIKQVRQEK